MEESGNLVIHDSEKIVVRLGDYIGESGILSQLGINLALDALKHFQEIYTPYTSRVRAVATHATRSARNRQDLLYAADKQLGIHIEVIDGIEEARLCGLGMQIGLHLLDTPMLGVDIGGGSTEIFAALGSEVSFVTSLSIGAVNLTRLFKLDNPTETSIRKARDYILVRLSPLSRKAKHCVYDVAAAASGTAKSIAQIDYRLSRKGELNDSNAYRFSNSALFDISSRLSKCEDAKRIRQKFSVDESRSEILLAGALIFEGITSLFNVKNWTISSYSLREGVVADTIGRISEKPFPSRQNLRLSSIRDFSARFQVDLGYAEHVATLANKAYSELKECGDWSAPDDDLYDDETLLRDACYLHEVGKIVSFSRYHRHSCYIISNCSVMGLTQEDKALIGLIVKFHRKTPTKKIKFIDGLPADFSSERLSMLTSCLRIATSLNRTRAGRVVDLKIRLEKSGFVLEIYPAEGHPPVAEVCKIEAELPNLNRIFGRKWSAQVIQRTK